MDYIFLRDYSPFKKGRIVKLPPMTSAKLLAAGIVAPYAVTRTPVKPKPVFKENDSSKAEKEEPVKVDKREDSNVPKEDTKKKKEKKKEYYHAG